MIVSTLTPTGTAANGISFSIDALLTVYTTGAGGTVTGSMTLTNQGVTGISAVTVVVSQFVAPVALDTTADKIIELTWLGANAESIRLSNVSIEIVKL